MAIKVVNHKQNTHLTALKRTMFRILFLSLLVLTLLGCTGITTLDSVGHVTPTTTALPPTKVVEITRYVVYSEGYFTYEDGCLFAVNGDDRRTLVWWPSLRPVVDEEKGIVEIITPNAEPIVIRLDEQLVIYGGGPTDFPRGPEFAVIDETAGIERCPPPYWLIGGPIKPQ